jgi:hypothetical protein
MQLVPAAHPQETIYALLVVLLEQWNQLSLIPTHLLQEMSYPLLVALVLLLLDGFFQFFSSGNYYWIKRQAIDPHW